MPQVELYINRQLMDLRGDESIEVDYSIFDISKIGSRGGARSYEFELPKTNNNKEVLENPEMVNNLSTVPYTRLPCLVLVDGVDVLIRFAEVSSVKGSYAIRLYGGNSDLFNEIKDLKLSELDLNEFNHFWTLENIVSNLNDNDSDIRTAYIYAIIDYHADSPNSYINNDNRTLRVDFLLPSIFINILLERIFTQFGHTFENEIADDTESIVLPFTNWTTKRNNNADRYIGSFSGFGPIVVGNIVTGLIPFNANISESEVYYQPKFEAGSVTTFFFADTINATFDFSFTILNSGGTQEFTIILAGTIYIVTALPGVNNYSFPITVTSVTAISVTIHQQVPTGNLTITGTYTLNITSVEMVEPGDIDFSLGANFTNNYLTPSTLVPDLTQMELSKNYMQMFSLLPFINEITKHIKLVRFSTILSKISTAYDWSNLIDLSEDEEVVFILNSYAQNNRFKYSEDGEETKPTGTDGNIVINNKNLEFEKDVVELKFAATNVNLRLMDENICQIGVFQQGLFENEKKPRVVNVANKVLDGALSLTDDVTTTALSASAKIPIPYFIDDSQELNLGFGNNLLTEYYELLSNILNRVKILKVSVRLSAADISQLDFSRPVWIQKFESYFYISAIKGFSYTESRSTIVELVKLNING